MISVTRINGNPFILNADLIRTVEANPDTTITLVSGDHLIVKETPEEVVEKTIEYGRLLRTLLSPAA
ncbi:MAG: flagellar FlbD family protein [Phycisphaerales bacterium JB043]